MKKQKLDKYGHRKAGHKLPKIMRYSNLNIHQKINIKDAYTDSMFLAKRDTVGLHAQARKAINSIFWAGNRYIREKKYLPKKACQQKELPKPGQQLLMDLT